MDKETRDIFILGMCVLFGWAFIIILCASPQLFREKLYRVCCRCCKNRRNAQEKIKMAEERMNFARRSFLATTLAGQPTAILLQLGPPGRRTTMVPEAIPEESRCTSMQPTEHGSSPTPSHQSFPDIKDIP